MAHEAEAVFAQGLDIGRTAKEFRGKARVTEHHGARRERRFIGRDWQLDASHLFREALQFLRRVHLRGRGARGAYDGAGGRLAARSQSQFLGRRPGRGRQGKRNKQKSIHGTDSLVSADVSPSTTCNTQSKHCSCVNP